MQRGRLRKLMTHPKNPFDNYAIESLGLNPSEFRVYYHLCHRAEEIHSSVDDLCIYDASHKDIGRKCDISTGTVSRVLRVLKNSGLIECQTVSRRDPDIISICANLDNFPGVQR